MQCERGGVLHALPLSATLSGMTDPQSKAAAELARGIRALREMKDHPAARLALRGLEAALPEASALVREAMADPAGTLGELVAPLVSAGVDELAEADRTIAAGLARAFGRGLVRGVKKDR